ncbi:uncharacterized protein E5676_scaffold85G00010 [Cucumis melo var. makuwa]|uniref:Uncharacterized protein n=1 Tax=Cucumis melo var. makuwa TaxID=1194695 RepID=A0A5A7T3Q3_CUCMM|nr:uncharacterized protein E6C27_scaffold278G001300 [Cucumis melo var. makuwa]TYJ97496.1 uncharacterized protein E5676_scaffold85G00010 [Cucumis melo var. makuwa]
MSEETHATFERGECSRKPKQSTEEIPDYFLRFQELIMANNQCLNQKLNKLIKDVEYLKNMFKEKVTETMENNENIQRDDNNDGGEGDTKNENVDNEADRDVTNQPDGNDKNENEGQEGGQNDLLDDVVYNTAILNEVDKIKKEAIKMKKKKLEKRAAETHVAVRTATFTVEIPMARHGHFWSLARLPLPLPRPLPEIHDMERTGNPVRLRSHKWEQPRRVSPSCLCHKGSDPEGHPCGVVLKCITRNACGLMILVVELVVEISYLEIWSTSPNSKKNVLSKQRGPKWTKKLGGSKKAWRLGWKRRDRLDLRAGVGSACGRRGTRLTWKSTREEGRWHGFRHLANVRRRGWWVGAGARAWSGTQTWSATRSDAVCGSGHGATRLASWGRATRLTSQSGAFNSLGTSGGAARLSFASFDDQHAACDGVANRAAGFMAAVGGNSRLAAGEMRLRG